MPVVPTADTFLATYGKVDDDLNKAVAERDALRAEHDRLVAAHNELKARLKRAEVAAAEKSLHPRVRMSLHKMILGMAMDKYHYKIGAAKNPATQNIADALARCGIPIDVDTVRARLKEADAEVEVKAEKTAPKPNSV